MYFYISRNKSAHFIAYHIRFILLITNFCFNFLTRQCCST